MTLALRLLTVIETQVRRGLAKDQETLAGLYDGQPKRTTDLPTGKRILKAFAKAKLTLTHVQTDSTTAWHITPLSPLHERLLGYLDLSTSLYTGLGYHPTMIYNSS